MGMAVGLEDWRKDRAVATTKFNLVLKDCPLDTSAHNNEHGGDIVTATGVVGGFNQRGGL